MSIVHDGDPTRYIYVDWSNGGGQTQTYTVTGAATVTANFLAQYTLTVASAHDAPNPSGVTYRDAGSSVTASVTTPADVVGSMRYRCTGWTGTESVPASGSTNSVTFTMSAPSTITWDWKTQYLLTIKTSGVGDAIPSKEITVTVNGVTTDDYGVTTIDDTYVNGWRKWIDDGTSATVSVNDPGGAPNWSMWLDGPTTMSRTVPISGSLELLTAKYGT